LFNLSKVKLTEPSDWD